MALNKSFQRGKTSGRRLLPYLWTSSTSVVSYSHYLAHSCAGMHHRWVRKRNIPSGGFFPYGCARKRHEFFGGGVLSIPLIPLQKTQLSSLSKKITRDPWHGFSRSIYRGGGITSCNFWGLLNDLGGGLGV